MSNEKTGKIVLLEDRGVVSVSGEDAATFLDNMITNDVPNGTDTNAVFGGLLTPQGKILFEFFVVAVENGFLLDTQRAKTADLVKRLAMYKLRANVAIADVSEQHVVVAAWGLDRLASVEAIAKLEDPRIRQLSGRSIFASKQFDDVKAALATAHGDWQIKSVADYDMRRIDKTVPEGDRDYPLGDTFPHDANWDLMGGVSFTKGCYVGQEVVARMQNKTVVRKRVVRIAGTGLVTGAAILHGAGEIGTIGTVAGGEALALVRLDRAAEAADKGDEITSNGLPIAVDPAALQRYRDAMKNRPVIDL
jgi:hypothetical protein